MTSTAAQHKRCTRCGVEKPVGEFHKRNNRPGGLRSECRSCTRTANREWRQENPERHLEKSRRWRAANPQQYRENHRELMLARRYGITGEQYGALLAFQGGKCAGCGTTTPGGKGAFHVDHDHGCCLPATRGGRVERCGKCVRGLLCQRCNLTDALAGRSHVDWAAIAHQHAGHGPQIDAAARKPSGGSATKDDTHDDLQEQRP